MSERTTRSHQTDRWLVRASPGNLLILYMVVALVMTVRGLMKSSQSYNNFTIFRASYRNLVDGVNLYVPHRDRYIDLYKYSPTFALLMGPFQLIPRAVGAVIWNVLNVWAICWGVTRLDMGRRAQSFVLLFLFFELLTSLSNAQSNGIVTGLMIGAFAAFERRSSSAAALLICLGAAIKPFAGVVGLLLPLYGGKGRFLVTGAVAALVLGLSPAIVTGVPGLLSTYRDWWTLLGNDKAHGANYSLMTLVERGLGLRISDRYYLAFGLLLMIAPLLRKSRWIDPKFRLTTLAGMLIWVVIFNHKAESPTYVIAVAGAGLWAVAERSSWLRTLLLSFVFLLTELAATDLFPKSWRMAYIQPYSLKALPCVVLWFYVTFRLMTWPGGTRHRPTGRDVLVIGEASRHTGGGFPADVPLRSLDQERTTSLDGADSPTTLDMGPVRSTIVRIFRRYRWLNFPAALASRYFGETPDVVEPCSLGTLMDF